MIRAEEIADPSTMFWSLLCGAFLIGLAVHAIFREHNIVWVSVATTIVLIGVLYTTVYRDAPSQDALWLIGLMAGFVFKFGAILGAGLLVRRLRK
jgi:Antenna complex alpha/beta subunit